MRARRWVAVGLTGVLFSACGGGSSGGKADTATDQKKGGEINLKLGDFPSGWTNSPHKDDPSGKALSTQLNGCLGIADPSTRHTTETFSDDFSQGQSQASSEVDFTKSSSEASSDFKAVSSAKAPGCIQQAFSDALKSQAQSFPGASIGEIKVNERPVAKNHGAKAIGYRATVSVTLSGQQLPVTADVALAQKGREEGTVTFTGLGTPVPDDLETKLVSTFESRM